MGDAREPASKGPDKADTRKARAEAPVAGNELLPWGPYATFFDLQRSLGNRVVSRMIERRDQRAPLVGRARHAPEFHGPGPSPIQRETPNATMPPPNQSVQPPAPATRNNGIIYQGEMLYPDSEKCKGTLRKMLAAKGFEGASSWGHSLLNPTSEVKAGWSLFADDDYVEQVQGSMRTAVGEFDEECRIFMEKFETQAGNLTDAMLINAEEKIKEEQKKLALQSEVDVDHKDRTVTTTYTATNQVYLGEAKAAATELAKKRELADLRADKASEARKKAEQQRAMLPSGFDPNIFGPASTAPSQPIKLGGQTVTIGPMLSEQEETHKKWREAEDDFKKAAQAATGKCALLGPLLSGGQGTAERLKSFAAENAAQSGQNLGEQFAEKLKNIQTVRGELGKRFSIWKQPAIISITHQQMSSGPGEQRMVRDKANKIAADEKSTKEMYAAIALGLGLLAAVPTGGSSVIAGVALAASVTGAALSAYTTYEEAQEYLLGSAAANTSLDRAQEISKDEPSLLWLAIDIAAAVTDLGAAKAAFTTLKETIAIARAAKSIEKLPEVIGKMRAASITPANQAKVINEILPEGGDIGKALHEIRQAFLRTAEAAENKEMAELMKEVGEKAMDRARVLVVPNSQTEALEAIKTQLRNRGYTGEALENESRSFFRELFEDQDALAKGGFFEPTEGLIVIRGSASPEMAAAILLHEAVHFGQDTMNMMRRMGKFRSEMESFMAQQQFLRMIPPEKIPEDARTLVSMTQPQLEAYVASFYAKEGAVQEAVTREELIEGFYKRFFSARRGL